eukprot:109641_1
MCLCHHYPTQPIQYMISYDLGFFRSNQQRNGLCIGVVFMSQSGSSGLYGSDTYTSYDESTLQLTASPQQKEARQCHDEYAQSFHPMNGLMVGFAAYNSGTPQVLSWAGSSAGAAAMESYPNNVHCIEYHVLSTRNIPATTSSNS